MKKKVDDGVERMMRVNELADYSGIPAHIIRQWLKENKFAYTKVGTWCYVNLNSYNAYVKQLNA